MFDIGWSELLVIAVVAIIVVGPKDLPRMMRTFGHYMGKVRRMAGDFQRQFEEAVRESEIEEVTKAIHSVRDTTAVVDLKAPIDQPLMLPQRQAGTSAAVTKPAPPAKPKSKPKPRAKSAAAKTTTAKANAKPAERKAAKGRKS